MMPAAFAVAGRQLTAGLDRLRPAQDLRRDVEVGGAGEANKRASEREDAP